MINISETRNKSYDNKSPKNTSTHLSPSKSSYSSSNLHKISRKNQKSLTQFIPHHTKLFYKLQKKSPICPSSTKKIKNHSIVSPNTSKDLKKPSFHLKSFSLFDFDKLNFISPCENSLPKAAESFQVAKTNLTSFPTSSNLKLSKTNKSPSARKQLFASIKKRSSKKFFSEFFTVSDSIDLTGSGYLKYSQYCKLLSSLHFINDSFYKSQEETNLVLKAWKDLGGIEQRKVKTEGLYSFLLKIVEAKFSPKSRKKSQAGKGYFKEFSIFNKNRTSYTEKFPEIEILVKSPLSIDRDQNSSPNDLLKNDPIFCDSFKYSFCNEPDIDDLSSKSLSSEFFSSTSFVNKVCIKKVSPSQAGIITEKDEGTNISIKLNDEKEDLNMTEDRQIGSLSMISYQKRKKYKKKSSLK